MYRLEFLPLARQDMIEAVRYISHELKNPAAARRLSNRLIEATERLTDFPYLHAVYTPIRPLKKEYRKLTVENYCMFYSVDEGTKTITIARVIYARRSLERLLE